MEKEENLVKKRHKSDIEQEPADRGRACIHKSKACMGIDRAVVFINKRKIIKGKR